MTDRAIWGGKATGLAKIMGAALTLPETACIACQNVPHLSDNDALDLALGTLPDSIAASLPDPGLVVRSSSTHEDGATASGAGLSIFLSVPSTTAGNQPISSHPNIRAAWAWWSNP